MRTAWRTRRTCQLCHALMWQTLGSCCRGRQRTVRCSRLRRLASSPQGWLPQHLLRIQRQWRLETVRRQGKL